MIFGDPDQRLTKEIATMALDQSPWPNSSTRSARGGPGPAGRLLAAVGGIAGHGRRAAPSIEIWAGVAGGVIAVAVHAASDFSWQVPAVPLTGALLVGIVMQPRQKESTP